MTHQTKFTTEAELRLLVEGGLSFKEISNRLGIRVDYIRSAAMVLGIRNPKRIKRDSADLDGYVDSLKAGKTVQQIADECGEKRMTVYRRLERAGLPTSIRAAVIASRA